MNKTYWEDEDLFGDEELLELLKDSQFDSKVDLQAEITLLKLIKVEDWYQDGTAVMRTLRRGKGRNPYTDSDIWCKCLNATNQRVFSEDENRRQWRTNIL